MICFSLNSHGPCKAVPSLGEAAGQGWGHRAPSLPSDREARSDVVGSWRGIWPPLAQQSFGCPEGKGRPWGQLQPVQGAAWTRGRPAVPLYRPDEDATVQTCCVAHAATPGLARFWKAGRWALLPQCPLAKSLNLLNPPFKTEIKNLCLPQTLL